MESYDTPSELIFSTSSTSNDSGLKLDMEIDTDDYWTPPSSSSVSSVNTFYSADWSTNNGSSNMQADEIEMTSEDILQYSEHDREIANLSTSGESFVKQDGENLMGGLLPSNDIALYYEHSGEIPSNNFLPLKFYSPTRITNRKEVVVCKTQSYKQDEEMIRSFADVTSNRKNFMQSKEVSSCIRETTSINNVLDAAPFNNNHSHGQNYKFLCSSFQALDLRSPTSMINFAEQTSYNTHPYKQDGEMPFKWPSPTILSNYSTSIQNEGIQIRTYETTTTSMDNMGQYQCNPIRSFLNVQTSNKITSFTQTGNMMNGSSPMHFQLPVSTMTPTDVMLSNSTNVNRDNEIMSPANQWKPSPNQFISRKKSCLLNPIVECKFCKTNGELRRVYRSHSLKDSRGIVRCPILRNYQCDLCGATGDVAHTRKYCSKYVQDNHPKPLFRRLANGVLSMKHNHK